MDGKAEGHPANNIANARMLRRRSTDAEKLLWKHLRMRQVNEAKFRRQQPIGNYVVDFVCFEKKLVVELDGGQHSDTKEYDSARTVWLQERGFRVLRYWNHEVLKTPEVVLSAILTEMEKNC